uniref:Uncharacterized protein n=1 Tax=Arundo donax TaxID=35708 RepID=A0A0A8YKW8_ARUDO
MHKSTFVFLLIPEVAVVFGKEQ